MNQIIDLHTHSTASDGTLSPKELVLLAERQGLAAISLTDHDTIDGIEEAYEEAEKCSLKFIPGIEISGEYFPGPVHILGYWIDWENSTLKSVLDELIGFRNNRNFIIIEKLNELGLNIDYSEVEALAMDSVVGRPHFAEVIVKKGFADSINDAFNKYLAYGRAAYMSKKRLSVSQGVDLIRSAGGFPVLAHPGHYGFPDPISFKNAVTDLKRKGIAGIEVYYPTHSVNEIQLFKMVAEELDLAITAGSDFHGAVKPEVKLGTGISGNLSVSIEILYDLESRHLDKSNSLRG